MLGGKSVIGVMSQTSEATPWWSPFLRFAAKSDIGMRRTNNQDSHYEVPAASSRNWQTNGHLFIVADGMGAHAAGEYASGLATETIAQSYLRRSGEAPHEAVKNAILEAHALIRQKGAEDAAFHDMGTTADVLLLLPEGALVGHVGDSRVYRLRDHVYEQLTFDHSLLWEITRSGRIAKEKYPSQIPKNVITRSLGPVQRLTVDLEGPFPIQAGDTFLLCSDGLSGQVEDDEMGQILSLFSPAEAAEALVNIANMRGGPDNITVVIANVLGQPEIDDSRRIQKKEKRRPLSAAGLTTIIASLTLWFLFLVLAVTRTGSFLGIALSALAAAAASAAALRVNRKTFFSQAKPLTTTPFGRGPYVRVNAEPAREFAEKLIVSEQELFKVVERHSSEVKDDPGGKFAELHQRCIHGMSTGQYGEAIFAVVRLINMLMAKIKEDRPKAA